MQQSEEENLTKKGKGIKTCHKKYLCHSCLLVAEVVQQNIILISLDKYQPSRTLRVYPKNGGHGYNIKLKRYIVKKWWQIQNKRHNNEDLLIIVKGKGLFIIHNLVLEYALTI